MIDFETGEEGLKGTLDFPQIGREGLVLSKVSLEDSKVNFELSDFRGPSSMRNSKVTRFQESS